MSSKKAEAPRLHFLAETGSTMDEARALALAGAPPGTVVVADRQTSGRGRVAGRTWTALAGEALLATLLLEAGRASLPGLTLRIGLALARACEEAAAEAGRRLRVEIKWPNDLLVDDRKLGGILCEAGPWGLLVGFGINVAQRGFAGELAARATSLLLETGAEALLPEPWPGTRGRLLRLALREIDRALEDAHWRGALEERLWGRGRVELLSAGRPGAEPGFRALILGIAESGALVVEDSGGGRRELLSGEIGGQGPR